jgi:MFS family permease
MRLITRTVVILSLVSLFNDVGSEMLYPIIPIYLTDIGFSVQGIGILEGFVNFAAGISKGYFGKLSDEKGLRLPFVRLGYVLSALSKPLIGFFSAVYWIFLARTMDRFGKGMRVAARDAMLSQEATKATKARIFGFNRALDSIGATVGPIIALIILLYYPGQYRTLFYVAFIPGFISIIFLFFLSEKKKVVSTLEKVNFFTFFKYWKIADPDYKRLVGGLLLFALFNSSDVFLLLKTKQTIGDNEIKFLGATLTSDTITIAAYVVYNLFWSSLSYPCGILADRIGFKKIFVMGLVLFAVAYAGFAFNPPIAVIFILFAIYGLFSAATDGVSKAWITNIAHNKNTATAIGFYTSCQSIATLLASVIAGAIWTNFGSFYTFISTAVIAVIVLLWFVRKKF